MDTPNKTRSNKKILPLVVSLIVIILAVIAGLVLYRNSLNAKKDQYQQSIDEAAVFASQNSLTDEQREKMVENVKKQPAVKLSPEEAAQREAEIINSFNTQ